MKYDLKELRAELEDQRYCDYGRCVIDFNDVIKAIEHLENALESPLLEGVWYNGKFHVPVKEILGHEGKMSSM